VRRKARTTSRATSTWSDTFSQLKHSIIGLFPPVFAHKSMPWNPLNMNIGVGICGMKRFLNAAAGRKPDYSLATCRPERNRWSQTLFHEHREARLKEWIRELEAWGFLV